MQRAATGLAVAIADLLGRVYAARVLLLVGAGDNGGDALWAGAMLARRGAAVEAVLLSSKVHHEGLTRCGRTADAPCSPPRRTGPTCVVDGIVGIGGRPGLRDEAAEALARFAGVPVVAVDVPSGVDVDTGRLPDRHVRADLTVTFGTHKIAHLVDPAAQACGVVHLVDIGLDLPRGAGRGAAAGRRGRLLPVPGPFDHKYTRGVVGVRAGSQTYPGAAVLCTSGAVSGLAGMVRYSGSAAETPCAPDTRRSSPRKGGCRPGSSAPAVTPTPRRRSPTRSPTACRPWSTPTRWRTSSRARAASCSPRTPASSPGCSASSAPRSRPTSSASPAAPPLTYDAVVLLKGRHTLVARPDGRVR